MSLNCFIESSVYVGTARQLLPADTPHWPEAGLMLGQRHRRWPNIKSALVEWLSFAGIASPGNKLRVHMGPGN